jgi:hypothetical protein
MTPKESDTHEEARHAAEQALRQAQQMPAGPERIAALRRAGQMRFNASAGEVQDVFARANEGLKRGHRE